MARRICLLPRLSGVGGMVSFQQKMSAGLAARGVEVCYDLSDRPYSAVLVIGGTRQIAGLWRARRRGVPIFQRLDGINWMHRLRSTGLRHYLRAEYGNVLLALIRSRLVDGVIYQSEFSRRWWERIHGAAPVTSRVVYNGVDLEIYNPQGLSQRPLDRYRLLLVEGSLMGGYESGLEVAVDLAKEIQQALKTAHSQVPGKAVELMVVGRVFPELQKRWNERSPVPICWAGQVPGQRIPEIDRSAHLLYSADVNAACPNSVIEALACGLPVVAFNTGALPELVRGDSGRIAAYGGDPWRLDPPDVAGLAQAAVEIFQDQERFRRTARARAEATFGLEKMVDGYLQAFFEV